METQDSELAGDIDSQIQENRLLHKNSLKAKFERMAMKITKAVGSSTAFVVAFFLILVWAALGPVFGYSDTWQLVINTSTTIVTFLMVFLIQQTQNKDSLAIQLKLNELIASNKRASNRLIDVEDLSQEELELLKRFYIQLSELAEQSKDLFSSHSVDEATQQHNIKIHKRGSKNGGENGSTGGDKS